VNSKLEPVLITKQRAGSIFGELKRERELQQENRNISGRVNTAILLVAGTTKKEIGGTE